ncbi:MAG: hypothetical protein QHH15_04815, partial [Candidatus Thermoplasmatota archaeon]|nr:hypothetical protein [Candidatus Thermoplasmatota archaeon]
TLVSPENGFASDSSIVTFRWNSANDSTPSNVSEVSNIKYYQLQIRDNENESLKNFNTSDNTLTFLTINLLEENLIGIGKGKLYWRVCAWDNAGNNGNWSETRDLTIFSYSLTADSSTIQIQRGTTGSTTLRLTHNFGVKENVSLCYQWSGDNKPSSIDVNFSLNNTTVSFNSTIIFICGEGASTGTFICTINTTSESGINRSVNIEITVYTMLFSLDVFPRSLSLIRSDQDSAIISVNFDQGSLSSVTLSGDWIGDTPNGVSVEFNPSFGTPSFDSTITFTTSSSATAGSFVYKVSCFSSGLTKIVNIYIDISKELSITITTDKQTYEKGQSIEISGTVKDPKGNLVNSGTAKINISTQNWFYTLTTPITKGIYNTKFYITFDKPDGNWNISFIATDSKGHETSSPQTTSIYVESPEIYEQYLINVISPTTGQVFKRGEIITFTIALINKNNEKIQSAEVKAYLESGEVIVFSENSPGIYTSSYELDYGYMLGDSKIYVEGKRYEDEKLKVGFNFIDFKVSTITFAIKLVEIKPGNLIEIDEPVSIKLEALYPDGSPVENSIIKATGPNDAEMLFSKSISEKGVYTTSFIPTEKDIGNWIIKVNGEDAYGNYFTGDILNIEIVHLKTLSYLLRYWWITAMGIIFIVSFTSFFGKKKLDKIKLRKIKDEILELKKLKEKNAIFYYSDFSIDRETYDHLSQVYESKIADLSKKLGILEKKLKRKNGEKQ